MREEEGKDRYPMKVAILLLADTLTHSDMGRATIALETAKELMEAGEDVQLLFEGAGTKWPTELRKKENAINWLYKSVESSVKSVCSLCACDYSVKDQLKSSGIHLAESHPSLVKLVSQGYQ